MLVSTKTLAVIKVCTTPATLVSNFAGCWLLLGGNRAARHPLVHECPLSLPGFHPLLLEAGIENQAAERFADDGGFRLTALASHALEFPVVPGIQIDLLPNHGRHTSHYTSPPIVGNTLTRCMSRTRSCRLFRSNSCGRIVHVAYRFARRCARRRNLSGLAAGSPAGGPCGIRRRRKAPWRKPASAHRTESRG